MTIITTQETQQKRVLAPQPELHLVSPCRLNEGVIRLEKAELIDRFMASTVSKAVFVPASGSGSRMFQFLFEFLASPNESNRGAVERFINHIEDFAFFHQFPKEVQTALKSGEMDIDSFVSFILDDNSGGLAHLPKGLIPFHKFGPFLLTPFHEHVLQGLELNDAPCAFHFTIRPTYQQNIEEQLAYLNGLTGQQVQVDFSVQNPASDAYAFTSTGEVALDETGAAIRRPAGHGALLENFAGIDAELIFLKNIDNVQHFGKSAVSIEEQRMLGGLYLEAREEIALFLAQPTVEGLKNLNERYQLFHTSVLNNPLDFFVKQLQAPLRVCGMVRNEGQPGGGPFWVKENGVVSKQIVEKAQINMRGAQYRLMVQSTHFNPVMMVCQGKNADGSAINFEQFRDESKYFIVEKHHKGQDIRFVELPGLWNGSMAFWNTIFVEIPSETFSPVKTILDLLDPSHKD